MIFHHTPLKCMISSGDIVRQMGCTRTEFARWLPGAARNAEIHSVEQGDEVVHHINTAGGSLIITTRALPPRRIALMCLPVLQIRIHFVNMGEAMGADFMHYFDLYTRRGGG